MQPKLKLIIGRADAERAQPAPIYPDRPVRDPQPRQKAAKAKAPLIASPDDQLAPGPATSQHHTLILLRRVRATDATRLTDNGPICLAYAQRKISEADFDYLNNEFWKRDAPGKIEFDAIRTRKGKKPTGLRARKHKNGTRFFWEPPAQLGGKLVRLHGTAADIAERCRQLQAQALRQLRIAKPAHTPTPRFTGTLGSLIRIYLADRTSPFYELRPGTQDNYRRMLREIDATYGTRRLATLGRHAFFDWHAKWVGKRKEHLASGFSKAIMLKNLFKFGLGQFAQCDRLRLVMQGLKFEPPAPRSIWATREQVNAIRQAAHAEGLHLFALGIGTQFETALRQKDIIGEWLRNRDAAPNVPSVRTTRTARWCSGLVWEEHVTPELILAKPTSKSNFKKTAVHDLLLLPMVLEDLRIAYPGCITESARGELVVHREKLPASGPVFLDPKTGKPWTDSKWRRTWRRLARKTRVPDEVQNRDERSGAVTEASNLGVDLEHVRQFAGHSQITTTQGYNRETLAKSRLVARARAAGTAAARRKQKEQREDVA